MCTILLVSTIGYFGYQTYFSPKENIQIPVINGNSPIPPEENAPTPPGSNRVIDSGRHILQLADEGVHKQSRREWWYFNVFFNNPDSDLKGYSLVVSFNQMKPFDVRFLKPDNLFIILFDDSGTSYNLATFNKRRGTLQTVGPGVNITFENSWAKGSYPSWHVHAVNNEQGFTADLDFVADFLPIWVEGRSANLPIAKYVAGDYYIPRCNVVGNMTWGGKHYNVSGTGYHDHVWETNVPRFISKGWDWCNFHFDNGWEMYLSKFIIRWPGNLYAGAIVISPNNRNLTEFIVFDLKYTETATPKGLPFMKYPKKLHLEAQRDDMKLSLDIDVYNTCQIVWKLGRTGMFEGPCTAKGTFSWSGYSVDLNGYGLSEFTRVKYLLGLPGILQK